MVADGKPNILLIIADDLGLDASAQYSLGNDLPVTPNLDALASDGIVFDNAWATPVCTTTRGTIITGLHGVNSGVDTVPDTLDTSIMTLQRHLSNDANSADYQSAVVGKWHIGGMNPDLDHPNQSGVPYYSGNMSGSLRDYFEWDLVTNGVESQSTTYHTTAVTDMAIDWITAQSDPWFMWLAYSAPHTPFHLPPNDLHARSLSGTDADIAANPREYFLAAIEAMDSEIGRLLNSLSVEERENTMIIFIGDNGTPNAVLDTTVFPTGHSKATLYEGGIRVPMIVSGAEVSRNGERESALVNTADIYPTVIEALGSAPNTQVDGVSFYDMLSEAGISSRTFNYSEIITNRTNGWTTRSATHKLIVFNSGDRELYDLDNDIREENNLIADSEDGYETIISELVGFADFVRNGVPMPPSEGVDITDAILLETSADCADYVNQYTSTSLDQRNDVLFNGDLVISVEDDECIFQTNVIPNHTFHDGDADFAYDVAPQDVEYRISRTPQLASEITYLNGLDNGILLNGVKMDILSAGCYNVGGGRVGCNDPEQPWRADPMFEANGFNIDSHNAHTQAGGLYHYHGTPNALFDENSVEVVIGFAADGYPIFSSYIEEDGVVRKVRSGYRLKEGERPSLDSEPPGNEFDGNPGGTYDGTYRDDFEYVEGFGDLDECNGMTHNGVYGYYMIDEFPWAMACLKGTPHESFSKRNGGN